VPCLVRTGPGRAPPRSPADQTTNATKGNPSPIPWDVDCGNSFWFASVSGIDAVVPSTSVTRRSFQSRSVARGPRSPRRLNGPGGRRPQRQSLTRLAVGYRSPPRTACDRGAPARRSAARPPPDRSGPVEDLEEHSCRAAVARLIVWLALHGRKPCAAETGTYCEARQRLPLGVVVRLARQTAGEIEGRVPQTWLWKDRRVTLVDGTRRRCPTPKRTRRSSAIDIPRDRLGFPLVGLVVLIALASGWCATGPRSVQGKGTGEPALFRTLWRRSSEARSCSETAISARFFAVAAVATGLRRALAHASRREVRLPPSCRLGSRPRRDLVQDARPGWMTSKSMIKFPMKSLSVSCGSKSRRRASGSMSWCW